MLHWRVQMLFQDFTLKPQISSTSPSLKREAQKHDSNKTNYIHPLDSSYSSQQLKSEVFRRTCSHSWHNTKGRSAFESGNKDDISGKAEGRRDAGYERQAVRNWNLVTWTSTLENELTRNPRLWPSYFQYTKSHENRLSLWELPWSMAIRFLHPISQIRAELCRMGSQHCTAEPGSKERTRSLIFSVGYLFFPGRRGGRMGTSWGFFSLPQMCWQRWGKNSCSHQWSCLRAVVLARWHASCST